MSSVADTFISIRDAMQLGSMQIAPFSLLRKSKQQEDLQRTAIAA